MFGLWERRWDATESELNKIKRAMQVLTFLALIGQKNSFKYKVLEKYIEFCEDEILQLWF